MGRVVKILRISSGKTQEDFAAELGVRMNTVSRWERNDSQPSRLAKERIRHFYLSQKADLSEEERYYIESALS